MTTVSLPYEVSNSITARILLEFLTYILSIYSSLSVFLILSPQSLYFLLFFSFSFQFLITPCLNGMPRVILCIVDSSFNTLHTLDMQERTK